MVVYPSGPYNIEQGNSAAFAVEFFDINGILSIPPSATMTVTYINLSANSQTDTVTMSLNGSFYTGTWSSANAALGLATYLALSSFSSVAVANGQLRIIQRN